MIRSGEGVLSPVGACQVGRHESRGQFLDALSGKAKSGQKIHGRIKSHGLVCFRMLSKHADHEDAFDIFTVGAEG